MKQGTRGEWIVAPGAVIWSQNNDPAMKRLSEVAHVIRRALAGKNANELRVDFLASRIGDGYVGEGELAPRKTGPAVRQQGPRNIDGPRRDVASLQAEVDMERGAMR